MDMDVAIGVFVVAAAICSIGVLVFWSRRAINRIASDGFGSARKIVRDRQHGR